MVVARSVPGRLDVTLPSTPSGPTKPLTNASAVAANGSGPANAATTFVAACTTAATAAATRATASANYPAGHNRSRKWLQVVASWVAIVAIVST
jgi:hypothetical protein